MRSDLPSGQPIAYAFDAPPRQPDADVKALLGGKGKSLADMTATLGLPVPPGFTIVTNACRAYLAAGWTDVLDAAVAHNLKSLEEKIGRRFGDSDRPLLLSVRSGGAVSMPGMMDTVLNVGLNDATTDGLTRLFQDQVFAINCRERLNVTYRKAVSAPPPDSVSAQLRGAIEAVFLSWNSDRAKAYRKIEGLTDDAGTAVTVQVMVFGNMDDRSGTGVVFSRNPSTGAPELFGDVLFCAQGEDVVAGTHQTQDIPELSTRLPEIGAELRRHVEAIERHYRDLVEVEFTIEAGRLWILQARSGKRGPVAALRIAHDLASDPQFPLTKAEAVERVAHLLDGTRIQSRRGAAPPLLAQGLAASPGLASGVLVTSSEEAALRAARNEQVILARPETSPADVEGIAAAAGLLTARGGFASHAAVVARGWGKPAVVGIAEMDLDPDGIVIGGQRIAFGDILSLDGATGEVFAGPIDIEDRTPPEVELLRAWRDSASSAQRLDATDDDLILLLQIKGMASAASIADILATDKSALEARLQTLADWIERPNPLFIRPSTAGVSKATAVIQRHGADLGPAAQSALDAFKPHNDAFKLLVTDWQTKPSATGRIANDHADAEYDAAILLAVGDCHQRTATWLATVEPHGPLKFYAARLDRAMARVRNGETPYLVSPRVDSYHNVWFELHEYLIRLAGRTRAAEEGAH